MVTEFRQKNGGRKSGSSKAKDTNKKAKKNEQSARNGDGSKQQEDHKKDDANSSDWLSMLRIPITFYNYVSESEVLDNLFSTQLITLLDSIISWGIPVGFRPVTADILWHCLLLCYDKTTK